ncbi:MAG: M48 family metalloprotease, partial [Acidimicrobiia bacterium]
IGLAIVAWILREAGDISDLFDPTTILVVLIGICVIDVIAAVIGTILALFRLPLQRRRLERRVLSETRAHVAEPGEHRQIQNLLEALAIAAGIPPPRFALIDDPAPNSFGVGTSPDNTIIGVTTGLDELLTRDELEAILAYEVSRVRSLDVALSSWTVALTGSAIESLETGDLRAIIGFLPLRFARRLQVWALRGVGPERDRTAIQFTRHPQALVDALEKLHARSEPGGTGEPRHRAAVDRGAQADGRDVEVGATAGGRARPRRPHHRAPGTRQHAAGAGHQAPATRLVAA